MGFQTLCLLLIIVFHGILLFIMETDHSSCLQACLLRRDSSNLESEAESYGLRLTCIRNPSNSLRIRLASYLLSLKKKELVYDKIIDTLTRCVEDKTYWANTYLRYGEVVFLKVRKITWGIEIYLKNHAYCPFEIQGKLTPFVNEIEAGIFPLVPPIVFDWCS